MARCLVTGGCGFIGSHLVEGLLVAGHAVRVLDDLSTGRRENLAHLEGRVEVLEGSVTDEAAVRVAVEGQDRVFHLAALPSVQRSVEAPLTTHHVCSTGTLTVLEAARRGRVRRVVYASSSSVYGDVLSCRRREDMACHPRSPYAVAKLAGEQYCQAYWGVYGFDTVCLRLFNVFGPRQRLDSPYSGVLARFLNALLGNESPVIFGNGQQSRDFTFVADAVQAFLRAGGVAGARGKVYNVGTDYRTTVKDLLERLARLVGQDVQPIFAAARPGDVLHSQADIRRAQKELGYRPHVTLEDGLRRTLATARADKARAEPCGEAEESEATVLGTDSPGQPFGKRRDCA